MKEPSSGYEGPFNKEEVENIPHPSTRLWRVEIEPITDSPDKIHVRIELDGQVIGMMRLPNNDHVRWVRERLQIDMIRPVTASEIDKSMVEFKDDFYKRLNEIVGEARSTLFGPEPK